MVFISRSACEQNEIIVDIFRWSKYRLTITYLNSSYCCRLHSISYDEAEMRACSRWQSNVRSKIKLSRTDNSHLSSLHMWRWVTARGDGANRRHFLSWRLEVQTPREHETRLFNNACWQIRSCFKVYAKKKAGFGLFDEGGKDKWRCRRMIQLVNSDKNENSKLFSLDLRLNLGILVTQISREKCLQLNKYSYRRLRCRSSIKMFSNVDKLPSVIWSIRKLRGTNRLFAIYFYRQRTIEGTRHVAYQDRSKEIIVDGGWCLSIWISRQMFDDIVQNT